MTVRVERAIPRDFLDIAALDRIAWPDAADTFIPDGEHIWRVWCEHATVLVGRLEAGQELAASNRIAGALVVFPTEGGETFLHKIMVHADCRGRGIGTDLMRAALERASSTVLLTVDPVNEAAIRLYRNFGFEVRERVPGYYRPHEDRLVMACPPKGRC